MRIAPRTVVISLVLLGVSLIVGIISLTTGDYHIAVPDVLRALVGQGPAGDAFIVRTLRLPRALVALLAGAALGMSGAMFQSVTRNPLGSPDVVGFTFGAATGALVAIVVFGGGTLHIAIAAVVGGVGTAVVVYLLAYRRGVSGYRLVLVGIGVSAMLQAVNGFLLTRAQIVDAQQAAIWLTGSLNGRGWEQARPLALALIVLLPLGILLGRNLAMTELGDDTARALGVPVERTRLAVVLVGVALAAVATAAAGPIWFVALVAPQVVKRLTRATGPHLLPAALMGALLLAASDLAAQRLFAPTQLPVGVLTGALGGIYLAALLAHEWRRS